jgi:aspartate racemase
MKTLGIIGGIAPESTIDYYRQVIAAYRARVTDGSYPNLIINSIDLKGMIDLIAAKELEAVTVMLTNELARLARAGAEVGLFASNTPHLVFDELQRRSPLPLISIVEETCGAAAAANMKRVGLFGTRFTMDNDFYPRVFARAGIEVVVPSPDDRRFIHDKYFAELVPGVFRDETRAEMLAIAARLPSIDGLILGGTELPLLLRGDSANGIPLLDTTRIHVAAAMREVA